MLEKYILKNKKPVIEPDLLKWGAWMQNNRERILKHTRYKGHLISTVFLGIDHRFGFGKIPILFETMIFYKNWSSDFDYQDRYESYQEEIAGHKKACAFLRKILKEK